MISLSESLEHLVLAREHGYRNSLTGELAEYVVDMRGPLLDHLLTHGRVGAAWRELQQRRLQGETRSKRVRRVLRAFVPLPVRRWRWERRNQRLPAIVESRRPSWLDPAHLKPAPPVSPRTGWLEGQVSAFGGATLASEADDAIQSVAGVSTRRPWADLDVWEFFLSLRAEVKFPRLGKKPLVRDLLRGRVPDVILDRRDKTFFDEAIYDRVDYRHLERWLLEPAGFRMPGVDYEAVTERIRSRELDLWEYFWVKDLAAVHAFLSTC